MKLKIEMNLSPVYSFCHIDLIYIQGKSKITIENTIITIIRSLKILISFHENYHQFESAYGFLDFYLVQSQIQIFYICNTDVLS